MQIWKNVDDYLHEILNFIWNLVGSFILIFYVNKGCLKKKLFVCLENLNKIPRKSYLKAFA